MTAFDHDDNEEDDGGAGRRDKVGDDAGLRRGERDDGAPFLLCATMTNGERKYIGVEDDFRFRTSFRGRKDKWVGEELLKIAGETESGGGGG